MTVRRQKRGRRPCKPPPISIPTGPAPAAPLSLGEIRSAGMPAGMSWADAVEKEEFLWTASKKCPKCNASFQHAGGGCPRCAEVAFQPQRRGLIERYGTANPGAVCDNCGNKPCICDSKR